MKKLFLFLFLFLFSFSFVKAESISVDKVFKDIDKNYVYYNELQSLYDRGIILPDQNGNFNPKANLTRDEFVGIVSEVSCKECIKPDVDFSYVLKHSNKDVFFDISKSDKYFYCIAEAADSGEVSGYDIGTSCQNGINRPGEKPFCPKNNIILEEALAIILRSGNLLSAKDAEIIRNEIKNGRQFPTILGNISPKFQDGSVYSFYPDFKKALDYTFTDYDKDGQERKLKLLDQTKNVNPKSLVTREDFLRMSYIALKNNSCKSQKQNDLGLKIDVLEKTCSASKINCNFSDFPVGETIFDFRGKISRYDDNGFVYNWRFYDYSNGNDIPKTGKYIDNHNFLKSGIYRIYLTVTGPKGENSETYTDINIFPNSNPNNQNINNGNNNNGNNRNNNIGLTSYIITDKIGAKPNEPINFTGVTNKGHDVSYSWDFGDGTNGSGKIVNHNYPLEGTYTVTLTVVDKDGNSSTSTTNIKISKIPGYDGDLTDTDGDGVPDKYDNEIKTPKDKINFICTNEFVEKSLFGCGENDLGVYNPEIEKNHDYGYDGDGDGISNRFDYCPDIKGDEKNFGCPIFEKTCKSDTDCSEGFFCENNYCKVKKVNLSCAYTGGHIINGNIECNSCPCDFSIDFNSKLRACDIIFPAITSPDYKDIYSKGKYFQIKK